MADPNKKDAPWDVIGNTFIQQYYHIFDNKTTRKNIVALYHPSDSLLTFEGAQFRGNQSIGDKLNSLQLDSLERKSTTVDCQPTSDGGVFICVLGQLKNTAANDRVMGFSQAFLLKQHDNSYFIVHDIFRLLLHDIAV